MAHVENVDAMASISILIYIYRHGPRNDVSVNDGPHIRRRSKKIILLYYIILYYIILYYIILYYIILYYIILYYIILYYIILYYIIL